MGISRKPSLQIMVPRMSPIPGAKTFERAEQEGQAMIRSAEGNIGGGAATRILGDVWPVALVRVGEEPFKGWGRSARDVGLREDREAVAAEDRVSALVVLHMEGESGAAAWAHEEGVAAEDVDFGLKQCGEEAAQFGGFLEFDDAEFADRERDFVVMEDVFDAIGVADDNTYDCSIG